MPTHSTPNSQKLTLEMRIKPPAKSAQTIIAKGLGMGERVEQVERGTERQNKHKEARQTAFLKNRLFGHSALCVGCKNETVVFPQLSHGVSPVSAYITQVGT